MSIPVVSDIVRDGTSAFAAGGGGSGAAYTASETPPSLPAANAKWFDTSSGIEYVWYEDGDSGQWVATAMANVANIPSSDNIDGGNAFSIHIDSLAIDGGTA